MPPGQENIGFSVLLPNEAYTSDTVSIELPSDAASASRSGKHWLFCPSTKEAYPSDTVSIELPSDAASASQSGKHWLFHPSTDEAYTNDATSIELPSDATKLLRPALQNDFNRPSAGKVHPSDAASCSRQNYVDLPGQSIQARPLRHRPVGLTRVTL